MAKQPVCKKCKKQRTTSSYRKSSDNIMVETEMSGFMITPVRHGTIMESEQYFVGDTWEKVKCSACNIVLDVDSADLECE